MGNEPGKLSSKHLDKNHIYEHHTKTIPKKTPSISAQSLTNSQNSFVSHKGSFSKKKKELTKIYELMHTMNFLHESTTLSNAFIINIPISLNNVLICNEEDLEPATTFTRDTFGGTKKRIYWDKGLIMRNELKFLLNRPQKNDKKNENLQKNLFIDLKISNFTQKKNQPPPQTLTKTVSQHSNSNQSEDKKSPQFLVKTNSNSNEEFQTANFSGLQQFLMNKSKHQAQNQSKNEETQQTLLKSHSENKIFAANSRKNSQTESEFSDFNNLSASNTPTHKFDLSSSINKIKNNENLNKNKTTKNQPDHRNTAKSPVKSANLIKAHEAQNFKKKEKNSFYEKKHEEKQNETHPLKRSLTPNSKNESHKWNDSTKFEKNEKKTQNLNNLNLSKKNINVKEPSIASQNNSSEEEPLHIKISLDLKKFNKNMNQNNNNNENPELENNQFLKSVVKDIDKLTQKMLSTNNNLAGLHSTQGFYYFREDFKCYLIKGNDHFKKNLRKPPFSEKYLSSNQQSETSESDYGIARRVEPHFKKK